MIPRKKRINRWVNKKALHKDEDYHIDLDTIKKGEKQDG
jgi:hypothetical protein